MKSCNQRIDHNGQFVVVISVAAAVSLEIDFSIIIQKNPYMVAFCGPDAEKWHDELDWQIAAREVEGLDQTNSLILTIWDERQVVSQTAAEVFAKDYVLTLDDPRIVFCHLDSVHNYYDAIGGFGLVPDEVEDADESLSEQMAQLLRILALPLCIVGMLLIASTAVVLALPVDTGPGLLPPSMNFILVFLAICTAATAIGFPLDPKVRWLLGVVAVALGVISLGWSFFLYTSVTDSNEYTWPTPLSYRIFSILTSLLLLGIGAFFIEYGIKPGPAKKARQRTSGRRS